MRLLHAATIHQKVNDCDGLSVAFLKDRPQVSWSFGFTARLLSSTVSCHLVGGQQLDDV
jgi:hypothetical protein